MHLSQYTEEMGERTDTGTDIMLSIPYVNGGTLLFQLPPVISNHVSVHTDNHAFYVYLGINDTQIK